MFYSLNIFSSLKKITRGLLVMDLFLFVLILLGIRFTNVLLQSVVGTLFISSIPVLFILVVYQWAVSKTFLKIIKWLVIGVLSLAFLVVFLFSFLETSNIYREGSDASFVPVQTIDLNSKEVVVYRTNGGATTDFGVRIQEERHFPLGIKRIKLISEYYHVKDLSLEYKGNGQLEITSITPTSNEYSSSLPKAGERLGL